MNLRHILWDAPCSLPFRDAMRASTSQAWAPRSTLLCGSVTPHIKCRHYKRMQHRTRLRGNLAGAVATIILMGCGLSQAQERNLVEYARAYSGQDNPIRLRNVVEASGRWVVNHYSNRQLATYGILDVTQAPYSADPTGKKDSTRVIQQAMKDARDGRLVTFLPGGTYRVSDTITCIQGVVVPDHWIFGQAASSASPITAGESGFNFQSDYFPCVLMGSRTRQRTVIMLAPRAPGFSDVQKPKPIIHFWARKENGRPRVMQALVDGTRLNAPPWDPTEPQPNISYNQLILDVDFVLGRENPGAVAIDHQGAQGSAIEDVRIDATGAFAGIHKAPGSGGGIHDLTVIGGRYGLYLKNDPGVFWLGAQPAPVISNVTLKAQTESAILYTGRGPLTVVGGLIEGGGVQSQGPHNAPWNGSMSFVDTVFRTPSGPCTITSNHSVFLYNVYFERSTNIACIEGRPELKSQPTRWTHVYEYVAASTVLYPQSLGRISRDDAVYLNGHLVSSESIQHMDSAAPPPDLQARHQLLPLPSWSDNAVANVRSAPYDAAGDGKSDDAPAIQRAIDAHDDVFLPKGEYRLSRPLILKSHTRLFGISNVLSTLLPMWSREFLDTRHPAPLVETVDDPHATTELALVELRVPVSEPAVYALRWRAGRNSVVRNIRPVSTPWEPDAPHISSSMIRVEDSGGGRWYDLYQDGWWYQGPDYRHLLVSGTREPLAFYMLNPEHARSDVQVEFRNAGNISVYSLKSEGDYPILWMNDCFNVRIYGVGGGIGSIANGSALRINGGNDLLLANIDPEVGATDETVTRSEVPPEDVWFIAAGSASAPPDNWFLITDTPDGANTSIRMHGTEQVALYKRIQ